VAEGFRSRRPHSSLISGLLGLEGISKREDSQCRSGRGGELAQVKDSMLCAQYGGLRNSEWVLKIAAFGVLVFAA
jgi:hypothetical protein